MSGDDEPRIRGPPREEAEATLEARLAEHPHLDMNLKQFLVVTGLSYDWDELKTAGADRVRDYVWKAYDSRRRNLSRRQRALETLTANRLSEVYASHDPPIRTIADLKSLLEATEGAPRTPGLGLVAVSYLNAVLQHYDVPSISITARMSKAQRSAITELGPYVPHFLLNFSEVPSGRNR